MAGRRKGSINADKREAKISRLETEIEGIDERLRICGRVGQSVSDLIRLAEGEHELPITLLFMLASQMVSALNSIAERRPDLILPLSRNLFSWPAFISRKREYRRANEKLMTDLQLGEGGVYSNRRWRVSAPSTQAAIGLLLNAQIRGNAWNLPPLTRRTKKIWFEASWKDFLARGIRPEEGKLQALGQSAVTGERAVRRATLRGMPHQTKAMKRDDMRAEIKRQVWNAFKNVVGDVE